MYDTFLVSDTHFGHANSLNFKRADGNPLRPFASVEEMDEHMIDQWNKTVRPQDKVYHLGDVVINRRFLHVVERLNGRKILIKGNHDIFRLDDYHPRFADIRAYHVLDKFVMSHVPVHESQLERWKANIHGHLHSNQVEKNGKWDIRYFNVSVESPNRAVVGVPEFTPIPFQLIKDFYDGRAK